MNPHAEAADQAIRQLANALGEQPPALAVLAAEATRLAGVDLQVARMLRAKRRYAKATRRATVGLDRLGVRA